MYLIYLSEDKSKMSGFVLMKLELLLKSDRVLFPFSFHEKLIHL